MAKSQSGIFLIEGWRCPAEVTANDQGTSALC
jgi:hypothetical protein